MPTGGDNATSEISRGIAIIMFLTYICSIFQLKSHNELYHLPSAKTAARVSQHTSKSTSALHGAIIVTVEDEPAELAASAPQPEDEEAELQSVTEGRMVDVNKLRYRKVRPHPHDINSSRSVLHTVEWP